MFKCCTKCEQEKPLTDFYANKNLTDGYAYQCKNCSKKEAGKNKDRDNAKRRERRHQNPEKYRKESLDNYYKFHDQRRAAQKIYYENNKELFSTSNKNYRKNNINSILLRNRARREKINSFEPIKQLDIDALLISYNNLCFYCKIPVTRGVNLHLDHKISLSRGGAHAIDNLVPSCACCNLKKGIKSADEFLKIINGNNK